MGFYPFTCRKCGNPINFPHVHCHTCGTRLDMKMTPAAYLFAGLYILPIVLAFYLMYTGTSSTFRILVVVIILLVTIQFLIMHVHDWYTCRKREQERNRRPDAFP